MSSKGGAQAPPIVAVSPWTAALYPLVWAAFITVLIVGPWVAGGYLFGTDWPGPRRFDPPSELASSAPVQLLLAATGWLVSGELAGKALIFACFFVAALGSYLATPAQGFVPRAAASTLLTVNPFVYGRLNYGQIFLAAAYAVLPLFAVSLRLLFRKPGPRHAVFAGLSAVVIGAFSPHVFLIAGLLGIVAFVTAFVLSPNARAFAIGTLPWVLVAFAVALVASSYWIVPLLAGQGSEGLVIATTGNGQLMAYAAQPDLKVGLVPNLLGLYGFWAEDVGRFLSMKAFVPLWPAALVVLLAVCTVGFLAAVRDRRSGLRAWVTGLVVAGAIGLVLEMGVSNPITAGLVAWLDTHFVIYRGMRDAGKWAALLALVYSQLFGLGVAAILKWLAASVRMPVQLEWASAGAAALLLALPLAYGNGLLFGAHGEIKPSHYPAGWYAADKIMLADPNHGRALFLPWHEYMQYSFIHNQNSVVASPAPGFFSVPILASKDPEVPGIAPPTTPDQIAVTRLVAKGSSGDWAEVLKSLGVRYVLVDKDLDWQSYSYLDSQHGLTKVDDLGSILVYHVLPDT
jgi:hypothetical protein